MALVAMVSSFPAASYRGNLCLGMVNQQLRSSRALRDGRRHIRALHAPGFGRRSAHGELQGNSLALQHLGHEVGSSLLYTVDGQALDVLVFSADARRQNCNGVTVVPVDRHLFKQWGANGCNAIARWSADTDP